MTKIVYILKTGEEWHDPNLYTLDESFKRATKTLEKNPYIIDYRIDHTEADADNVKHPQHYNLPSGKELKDVLSDLIGDDATASFFTGNIIKYVIRHENKNGIEDLRKAKQYIDMLIELKEK